MARAVNGIMNNPMPMLVIGLSVLTSWVIEPLRSGTFANHPQNIFWHGGVQLPLNGPETTDDQNQREKPEICEDLEKTTANFAIGFSFTSRVVCSIEQHDSEQATQRHDGGVEAHEFETELGAQRQGKGLAQEGTDIHHLVED